jgi:RNA polymerase primary sigma factor
MTDIEWYMNSLRKYKILSNDEQSRLCQLVYDTKDKRAKDKLILHNMPLVVHIVNKYTKNANKQLDYIQEGSIGLSVAVDKFNPNVKAKFTTYAYWCILRKIQLVAIRDRQIRIPDHVEYKIKKVNELCEGKELEDALMDVRMSKALWDELHEKSASFKIPYSLESIQEENTLDLHDTIPDTTTISPDLSVLCKEYTEDVLEVIEMLPSKQQKVIKLYYGIGCESISKANIAKLLGYSTVTIRNIIILAHDKMLKIILRNRMFHLVPNLKIR